MKLGIIVGLVIMGLSSSVWAQDDQLDDTTGLSVEAVYVQPKDAQVETQTVEGQLLMPTISSKKFLKNEGIDLRTALAN